MGADKIRRSLKLEEQDAVGYCENKILSRNCNIKKAFMLYKGH